MVAHEDPALEAPPRPARPSPIPWVMAGITVILLGACLVLDQWATTRVESGDTDADILIAIHFGRTGVSSAAQTARMDRAVRVQTLTYGSMLASEAELRFGSADEVRTTRRYGTLLLILTGIACLLRLVGAGLVAHARGLRGVPGRVYVLGTLAVGAVCTVALLFNTGGAVGAHAEQVGAGMTSGLFRHGFGISAWGSLLALIVDGLGILMVKTAFRPPPTRTGARRRRRIKS